MTRYCCGIGCGAVKIIQADCLEGLPRLLADHFHCVVTSPPYFALRSYLPADHPLKAKEIGSEPTPEAFIETMVAVFREVRRVMHPSGLCFINLGDGYSGSGKGGGGSFQADGMTHAAGTRRVEGDGQLLNIPHRVAEALRADGWIWRQTIVWAKTSPMPESVKGWRWERCRVKVKDCEWKSGGVETGSRVTGRSVTDMGKLGMLAQWEPCPGCKKCARITGGNPRCQHEWASSQDGSRTLTSQTEMPIIKDGRETTTVGQANGDNRMLDMRAETPCSQNSAQTRQELGASGAKADTAISSDRTIPVQESADEIGQEHFGDAGESHDLGLARDDTIATQNSRQFTRNELDAPQSAGPSVSDRPRLNRGAQVVANKPARGHIISDEIKTTPVSDASIGENQAKDVGHIGRPLSKEVDVDAVLPKPSGASVIASGGTEDSTAASVLPAGSIDHLAAVNAGAHGPPCSAFHRTESVLGDLGLDDKKISSTSFAFESGHDVSICCLCGAVNHGYTHDGYVLRKGKGRCTTAYEYIFVMAKTAGYFWDSAAFVEESEWADDKRAGKGRIPYSQKRQGQDGTGQETFVQITTTRNPRTRNPRSVWRISAEPTKLKHFASYPSELVRRCVQAGTSDGGCCPECGMPWAPVVETEQLKRERPNDRTTTHEQGGGVNSCGNTVAGVATNIIGYRPTCECGADNSPCRVLDPFAGIGTTIQTARWMKREATGIELNPEYAKIAKELIYKPPRWWLRNQKSTSKRPADLAGQRRLF